MTTLDRAIGIAYVAYFVVLAGAVWAYAERPESALAPGLTIAVLLLHYVAAVAQLWHSGRAVIAARYAEGPVRLFNTLADVLLFAATVATIAWIHRVRTHNLAATSAAAVPALLLASVGNVFCVLGRRARPAAGPEEESEA